MFTQPCFIRKNTQDIREELESLGYKYSGRGSKQDKLPCLYCFQGQYYECNNIPGRYDKIIDCGTNESKFLALAALRDDTDKNQWFASNYSDKKGAPDEWRLCKEDNYEDFFGDCPYVRNYDDYHKASVEELIEHFKE